MKISELFNDYFSNKQTIIFFCFLISVIKKALLKKSMFICHQFLYSDTKKQDLYKLTSLNIFRLKFCRIGQPSCLVKNLCRNKLQISLSCKRSKKEIGKDKMSPTGCYFIAAAFNGCRIFRNLLWLLQRRLFLKSDSRQKQITFGSLIYIFSI